MRFSYQNDANDAPWCLAFTIASEFMCRLCAFLERQDEDGSAARRPPLQTALTVQECVHAALEMLERVDRIWHAPSEVREAVLACQTAGSTSDAMQMIALAGEAGRRALTPASLAGAVPGQGNARLMQLLTSELFARFEIVVAEVLQRTNASVDPRDMVLMRAYLETAVGMVRELRRHLWTVGTTAPVHEVIASLSRHVLSPRLEEGGTDAVEAITEVYEVFAELAGEVVA